MLGLPDLKKCFGKIGVTKNRAALKGTNLRGQTPICNFLQVPAVSCENQHSSAKICIFPNALFSRKRRESAKIREDLRLGSVYPAGGAHAFVRNVPGHGFPTL